MPRPSRSSIWRRSRSGSRGKWSSTSSRKRRQRPKLPRRRRTQHRPPPRRRRQNPRHRSTRRSRRPNNSRRLKPRRPLPRRSRQLNSSLLRPRNPRLPSPKRSPNPRRPSPKHSPNPRRPSPRRRLPKRRRLLRSRKRRHRSPRRRRLNPPRLWLRRRRPNSAASAGAGRTRAGKASDASAQGDAADRAAAKAGSQARSAETRDCRARATADAGAEDRFARSSAAGRVNKRAIFRRQRRRAIRLHFGDYLRDSQPALLSRGRPRARSEGGRQRRVHHRRVWRAHVVRYHSFFRGPGSRRGGAHLGPIDPFPAAARRLVPRRDELQLCSALARRLRVSPDRSGRYSSTLTVSHS